MLGFSSRAESHTRYPVNIDTSKKYLNVREYDTAPKNHQQQQKVLILRLFQCAVSILAALICLSVYNDGYSLSLPVWRAGSPLHPSMLKAQPSVVKTTPILEVFQVYKPLADKDTNKYADNENTTSGKQCEVLLMEHSFGFSYGKPFVGDYHPPNCKFNTVTMNFTVISKGRQFDRLAIMYLNDTEIYRTSTAEPTVHGIRWEYHKDMTAYLSLWNSPQKIIFDLGNLVNDLYTGSFNATLVASFSFVADTIEPASLIVPISARKSSSNAASLFMLPGDKAFNTIQLPRNINRAIFSVSACGQAQEEFFWANTLQSDIETFSNTTGILYGHSPFREVQVLIDGELAGVQWPFPVIFTGGVVPGLWRPIVGIDAFDLKEHEIDISPWLSVLCDGKEHTFEIKVFGIDNHGDTVTLTAGIGSSWYVTGKIFVWQNIDSNVVINGTPPMVLLSKPSIELKSVTTQDIHGINDSLAYVAKVQRTLRISSIINTSSGNKEYSWSQTLSLNSYNRFTRYGEVQQTVHTTSGLDQSTGPQPYISLFDYDLNVNNSYSSDASGNFTLDAALAQRRYHLMDGISVFDTPSEFTTELRGSAHYFASPEAKLSTGFGNTSQVYDYYTLLQKGNKYKACAKAKRNDRYFRNVTAVNGTVTKNIERICDEQVLSFVPVTVQASIASSEYDPDGSPKKHLGRGPS